MGVNLSLEGYFEVSVNQTRLSRLTKPALLWFPPRWESICPMKGSLRDDLGDQPRRSPRAELDWNPATCFGNQDVDVVKDDPVVFSTLAAKINCCIYMLLFTTFSIFVSQFFLQYLFFVSFAFFWWKGEFPSIKAFSKARIFQCLRSKSLYKMGYGLHWVWRNKF